MKTDTFKICIILIFFTLVNGCKNDFIKNLPSSTTKAKFSYTASNDTTAPSTIKFSNTSENATYFKWDFGDGTSSTEQSPTVIYSNSGNFIVTLKASNFNSVDSKTQTINIKKPVDAVASFTYSINNSDTLPVQVTFTNTSDNATAYKWDFGNGTTSTEKSPTISYYEPGEYRVFLIASNLTSNDTLSHTVTISRELL